MSAKKLDLDTIKAVSERSAQKMEVKKTKAGNKKNAGRKPVLEKAINKISLNLTNTEKSKFDAWCAQNGMTMAAAIRYCLTKNGAL